MTTDHKRADTSAPKDLQYLDNEPKSYVYVIIRTDLSIEQQIVQASHAALEAGFRFKRPQRTASIVLLCVPDRAALECASERLHGHGIDHHLFFEPDFDMGHSALATRPIFERAERFLMRKYKLFGRGKIASTQRPVPAPAHALIPRQVSRHELAMPMT